MQPSESSESYSSQLWTHHLVINNEGGKTQLFLLRIVAAVNLHLMHIRKHLYHNKTVVFGIVFENIQIEIISLNLL